MANAILNFHFDFLHTSLTIYIQSARVFRPSFRRIVVLILVLHLLCWNFLEKVFVKRSSPKMSIIINTVSTWNISQSVYNNHSSRHFFKLSFRLSLVRYFQFYLQLLDFFSKILSQDVYNNQSSRYLVEVIFLFFLSCIKLSFPKILSIYKTQFKILSQDVYNNHSSRHVEFC